MSQILIGKDINKSFNEDKNKQKILNNVSISIESGEFISIMGPSGSGKSTLMYILSGMDKCDSGSILFHNKDLSSLNVDELANIRLSKMGFVFQQPSLLKNLNILDNIILPSVRLNKKNVKSITNKALSLMKKVGLENLENRSIAQVSGGQLQRAGICRALMNDPEIIFGDEPTGALNSKSAQEIMDILRYFNKNGTTILLVTHDAKVAAQSDKIMFMKDGKIIHALKLSKFDGTNLDDRLKRITQKMHEIGI
ncbi:ABC transporter ATP-binding protein [Terrisporobacter glycolicus]|uniref:Macrolide export ATP-binding/permease protein MacB n=1 Tax=Terrisporobacter glycolicus ATCC 14880 = DSM 1288 TaxID=1121315 RepID=A0ABZ2EUC6_9FIRM|nr:ABC transporter ATP-binding protein [Terrisporobacter glycolicus]